VAAWAVGEGIIIYRAVKQRKAPPMPGQLVATSALFIMLALLAESDRARGLAVTLAECCVSGPTPVGVRVDLDSAAPLPLLLFGEGPSRIVVSVRGEAERHFEQLMEEFAIPWRWIGRVTGDRFVLGADGASVIDLALDPAVRAWRTGFERYVG